MRRIENQEGDIILIRWFDAWHDPEYQGSASDIRDFRVELEDVGFYIKEEDGYVVTALERSLGGNYRHLNFIPRVNIRFIKRLRNAIKPVS